MPTLLRTCRPLCCTWQGSVQRICCLERKNDHLHMKKSNEQSKTPCAKLLIARLLLSLAFISSERFSDSTTGPVSLIWSGQNCKWYLIKFVYILFSKQASCPCPPSFQRTWWPGLGFCVQPDTTLVALCLYVLTPLYLAAHTLLKKYKFSQNAVNTVQIPAWLHSTVTGKPLTAALHFTLMGAPYSMELRPKMEKNLAMMMMMMMMMMMLMVMILMMKWWSENDQEASLLNGSGCVAWGYQFACLPVEWHMCQNGRINIFFRAVQDHLKSPSWENRIRFWVAFNFSHRSFRSKKA